VNGVSLFSKTGAGERDLWGRFSPDYANCGNKLARDENERIAKTFSFESPADIAEDRVALFVCPQCGDLGCGAITCRLSRHGETVRWSQFAYEDGFDDDQNDFERYSAIGPFEFATDEYLAAIANAAHAHCSPIVRERPKAIGSIRRFITRLRE